jgi:hypothetical protein
MVERSLMLGTQGDIRRRAGLAQKRVVYAGRYFSLGEPAYLWHILSILVVIAFSCLLFYQSFNKPGMLLHVDMVFPNSVDRVYHTMLTMWIQYGSMAFVWNAQRVLWMYPLLLVAKLFGLSASQYLLLLFTSTFALAGVSMYALAYNIIKEFNFKETLSYAPYAGAIIAALIYMYNPWSLGHLWTYFGYPAYAVMPLVFLLLVKAMGSEKPLIAVIPLVLLMSFAGTSPIGVVWFAALISTYALFHLAIYRFEVNKVKHAAKVLLQTAGGYLALNALWVVPFLGALFVNKPLIPSYNPYFGQSASEGLSSLSTVMNNLRLSGWGGPNNLKFDNQLAAFLSFALPIFSILALYLLRDRVARNRKTLYMAVLFIVAVLIATGTAFILKRPYEFLEFHAPGSGSLGWIIRAPDRWLFFVPAFYAALLGSLAASVIKRRPPRDQAAPGARELVG